MVRLLLDAGADPNAEAGMCDEPLMCTYPLIEASELGHAEVVKLLLSAGANVSSIYWDDCGEHSALSIAAVNGHLEVSRLLLAAGADANQYAPILGAVRQGDTDMVKLLVENGAEVNCHPDPDRPRTTPLTEAVALGLEDMVDYLLKHGALMGGTGKRLLSIAIRTGHERIAQILRNAGAE